MNSFAHIFIGKEFEQLGQKIGRAAYRHGGSAVSYLNYYVLDFVQSQPILKRLSIENCAPTQESTGMDTYFNAAWIDCELEDKNLTSIYKTHIATKILGGINRESKNCLYICIHFPFYKREAFTRLEALYNGIQNAQMPNKLSFIGYCSELAPLISLDEKNAEKLAPKAQIEAYKQFREKNDVMINQRLLLFQNSFQNGMPLNLTNDSLVDTLALLLLQYVEYYDNIYPDTVRPSDMVSFGISAISLDKYRFVDYLFCQTMLHSMDASSVMEGEVDVNKVFAQVRVILHNKDKVLSEYLEKYDAVEKPAIVDADAFMKEEAEDIVNRCESIMQQSKSMPAKAAIMAALLQTKCDLFHEMVFDPDSPDLNDIFNEPVDYFIEHDRSHYFWENDVAPVNPIKELKALNTQLINSESQIRKLKKMIEAYELELENQKTAEKVSSFGDDGYYYVDDKKYKLLPSTDEEPLQETYQAHEVHVDSLDLRRNFREIQDQGSQGSCLAFAITSIFEYVMRSNNRCEEYDLSEAFLYYNARKLDPDGSENIDSGSRFKPALDSLCEYGIAKEALCRYDEDSYDVEPTAEAYADAKNRLLRKALNVTRCVSDIKSALEDGYPVAASFTLFPSFSNLSRGFVTVPTQEEIEETKNSENKDKHSRHAMVIVGFDDKIQCFLVRNSWGADWGEKGYCYIPYKYIENSELLNFACILTEIESIDNHSGVQKDIPILRLDDGDVYIRYRIALASLQREISIVEDCKTQRALLSSYLEVLKHKFSNHTDCDEYINRTCEKIKSEQDELCIQIKQEYADLDKEYNSFKVFKKRAIIKTSCISIGVLLVTWLYNYLIGLLNDATWRATLHVDWVHYVVILIVISIFFFKGHRAWRRWKETKNEHERQIKILNKQVKEKRKEIDGFRLNTHIARKWLSSLNDVYLAIQKRYTSIISRINNLRSWYADVEEMNGDFDFTSEVPYTTLLDTSVLDGFYETDIKNNPDFEIDFSDELEQHKNTEEYIKMYKTSIRDKIIMKLIRNQRLNAFNITDHIISSSYTDIARKVVSLSNDNSVSIENVKRQSEIFMHINPVQRGIIVPSTYVFAPKSNYGDHKLRQKLGHSFDEYLPSTDKSCLVMLQIMYLQFEECVMFQ